MSPNAAASAAMLATRIRISSNTLGAGSLIRRSYAGAAAMPDTLDSSLNGTGSACLRTQATLTLL